MSTRQPLRVAIYTRKSSEEGLEQEFNSLHAQREACEAYILSQRELGWKLHPKSYDDGGLSGGSMKRPALQALLDDVRANRVDVIVVYKIDRLTRSLMDFSKIVSTLDEHDVSFVSVTQQFNTSTSMGRLTLNMLLSFAQFEREVTAERIRDKFAASKARGMWMGGVVPLGYDVRERKLHINHKEAEAVRWLFATYLKLKSVVRLREAAFEQGILSKKRNYKSGRNLGGTPLTRGHLHAILTNRIYVGMISYKDKVYEGQHKAIIDQETFDAVQAQLKQNSARHRATNSPQSLHLLTGCIFDETGDRLSPSHARKKDRRYRYYVSHRLLQGRRKNQDGWRLPALSIETIVTKHLVTFLNDKAGLLQHLKARRHDLAANDITAISGTADQMATTLQTGSPQDKRQVLQSILHRIAIAPGEICIEINRTGLCQQLSQRLGMTNEGTKETGPDGVENKRPVATEQRQASFNLDSTDTAKLPANALHPDSESHANDPIILHLPIRLRRRWVENKLILQDQPANPSEPDPALIRLIITAHACLDLLTRGDCNSLAELSHLTGQSSTEISRILPLAFLAPDITRSILEGRQPVELTAQFLKRTKPLPQSWPAQRQKLDFASAG